MGGCCSGAHTHSGRLDEETNVEYEEIGCTASTSQPPPDFVNFLLPHAASPSKDHCAAADVPRLLRLSEPSPCKETVPGTPSTAGTPSGSPPSHTVRAPAEVPTTPSSPSGLKALHSRFSSDSVSCFFSAFLRRLHGGGINVLALPVTRTAIPCRLKLNGDKRHLLLIQADGPHCRSIPLEEVCRVMNAKSDLLRIEHHGETLAQDDDHCCAVLLKSQRCVCLRFSRTEEQHAFAQIVYDLLREAPSSQNA